MAQRVQRRLRPIGHAQLDENIADVGADGRFRDEQLLADLIVAEALSDEAGLSDDSPAAARRIAFTRSSGLVSFSR